MLLSHHMVMGQAITKPRAYRCHSNQLDQVRQLLSGGPDDIRFKRAENVEPVIEIHGQRDQLAISGSFRDGQEQRGGSVRMIQAIKLSLVLR